MAMPRHLKPSVVMRRNALYKGVFGGSRLWMAVGAVLWGRGAMKRVFGKQVEVVSVEKLKRGQAVHIDTFKPPTRRQRRAARRAS